MSLTCDMKKLIGLSLGLFLCLACGRDPQIKTESVSQSLPLSGVKRMDRIVKTDEEWRKILTPEQFEVARAKGTERAFCGKLTDHKEEGIYKCVCCDLPLFSSKHKLNSGTGWPSFYDVIDRNNVATESDTKYGMIRTEILCARCDAHLGHVFDDGPAPTGLRYCLNSVSMVFEAEKKH